MIEDLKKEADELGISYPANIGVEKLKEKIELADAPDTVKLKPRPSVKRSVKIKKNLSRRPKQKEVWLKTPHYMACTNPDNGKAIMDSEGFSEAIPILVCCPVKEAVKLIKKYKPSIDIDDEGDLETVTIYEKASTEEIEAYQEEMAIRRDWRTRKITQRKLKEAKHIVNINAKDL